LRGSPTDPALNIIIGRELSYGTPERSRELSNEPLESKDDARRRIVLYQQGRHANSIPPPDIRIRELQESINETTNRLGLGQKPG
jgi:hypothetical protein